MTAIAMKKFSKNPKYHFLNISTCTLLYNTVYSICWLMQNAVKHVTVSLQIYLFLNYTHSFNHSFKPLAKVHLPNFTAAG
jgi:hypothetical protein